MTHRAGQPPHLPIHGAGTDPWSLFRENCIADLLYMKRLVTDFLYYFELLIKNIYIFFKGQSVLINT